MQCIAGRQQVTGTRDLRVPAAMAPLQQPRTCSDSAALEHVCTHASAISKTVGISCAGVTEHGSAVSFAVGNRMQCCRLGLQ